MTLLDSDLASNASLGSYTPDQLFIGEADVVTEHYTCAAATVLAKLRVVALVSGKIVAFDSTASDGSQIPFGVMCQPKAAQSVDKEVSIYRQGHFNHAMLVWDTPTNTLALRQAAFKANSGILIGAIAG